MIQLSSSIQFQLHQHRTTISKTKETQNEANKP